MIPDPQTAIKIAGLENKSPGAVELAVYASVAVKIESELLRALRLKLAPQLDVGCEADLWHSRLVLASGPSGFTFRPDVAELLRNRLRDQVDRNTAVRAWDIIREMHEDTSPAIQLEEAIAWLAVTGGEADIEQRLNSALKAMVEDPDRGLAAWWMRARRRFPATVISTAAAARLDRTAMVQLGMESDDKATGDIFRDRLLRDAGETSILVRRNARAVEIGALEPDAATWSISVPLLKLIRIELIEAGAKEPAVVSLTPGQSRIVPVGEGSLLLKTERGDLFDLTAAEVSPSPAELLALTDLLQACGSLLALPFRYTVKPGDTINRIAGRFYGSSKGLKKIVTENHLTDSDRLFVGQVLLLPDPWPSLRSTVGVVAEAIVEYVDPQWRRGLRLLRDLLPDLPDDPLFSEFIGSCIALLAAQIPAKRAKTVHRLRRSIEDGLRVFDDWAPEEPEDPLGPTSRLWKTIDNVSRYLEKDTRPGEPLRGLSDWIMSYTKPQWHSVSKNLLKEDQREGAVSGLDAFVDQILGNVKQAIEEMIAFWGPAPVASRVAIKRESLEFLRRHRPDLDFIPEPASKGYRLVGKGTHFSELLKWTKDRTRLALQTLIEQRRKAKAEAAKTQMERLKRAQARRAEADKRKTIPKIFICYRREDSQGPAQRIYESLVEQYGSESIVFDIDTIPLGADFREYLNEEVGKCDIFLAVIGDRWLEILNKRLDEPNDFVRFEIQTALERGIPIVPVLVGSKSIPSEIDLPSKLAKLSHWQAVEVRAGADFEVQLKRLVDSLDRLLHKPETEKKSVKIKKTRR